MMLAVDGQKGCAIAIEEVRNKVAAIFADKLMVKVPSRDSDLLAEGHIDSVLFVDLLLTLEQDFAIAIVIDELDLERFQSINRIADFVADQLVAGQVA